MASNLDYLNPALLPLEDKVNAFLEAEKKLSRAKLALKNLRLQPEQPPGTATYGPSANELEQEIASLQQALPQLEHDVIQMLPTRNEWLKVNLGYGPSRVGAWHVPAAGGAPERYELRVVH